MSKKLAVPVLLIIIIGAVIVMNNKSPSVPEGKDEIEVPDESSETPEEPTKTEEPSSQPGDEHLVPCEG